MIVVMSCDRVQRVEGEQYSTTRQFLHDTEWILHNCIIYNGGMFKTFSHLTHIQSLFLMQLNMP